MQVSIRIMRMIPFLDNRELVIVILTIGFVIYSLTRKQVRESLKTLLRSFFVLKILIPLLLSSIPVVLLLSFLGKVGILDGELLKESIIWIAGTGFVMFINSASIKSSKELIKRTALTSIKSAVLLEFIIGLYVLPFGVELVIVPLSILVVLMLTVAKMQKDEKHIPTIKVLKGILIALGSFLIINAILHIISEPSAFFSIENLKLFLLPILLTFAYIPSIYILSLYSAYELLFITIDHFNSGNSVNDRLNIKLACMKKVHISLDRIYTLMPKLVRELNISTSKKDALKLIRNIEL